MNGSPRRVGAGPGGGLLMAGVLAFVAALAWQALGGAMRLAVVGAIAVAAGLLLADVLRRR